MTKGIPKTEQCRTKYPVVLIHGIGWKDLKMAEYWFRVPPYLEERGATVYVTNQDAWNTHKVRAQQIADEIGAFIQQRQCEKVNLVCHSQGSLDARWLIEKLEMKNKDGHLVPAKNLISSYTSIGGVHLGTTIADILTDAVPDAIKPWLRRKLNRLVRFMLADKDPKVWQAGRELTTDYMQNEFNKECPPVTAANGGIKDGVYFQSYATRMTRRSWFSLSPGKRILLGPWLLLRKKEGDNDGLVSVASQTFGNFRGVTAGVSHYGQINHFFGLITRFNSRKWLAGIIADLKEKGF